MRGLRIAGLVVAILFGLGVVGYMRIIDRDMSRCRIPAIGFGTQPGGDPDAGPRDWLGMNYGGPVDIISVKERTDEGGRPKRIVTWATASTRVKTYMVRGEDGTWHGGLESVGC